MAAQTKAESFKKGDIVSITYRDGYDSKGQPIIQTLFRTIVLGCEGDYLKVAYREVPKARGAGVNLVELDFNMSSAAFIMAQCER